MKKFYLKVLIMAVALPVAAGSQTLTQRSYEQARAVLDKSVNAYGGLDTLRSARSFSLRAVGDTVQRNQSKKPFTFDRTPFEIDIALDLAGNRFVQVTKGGYPGGFTYNSGFTVTKADGVSFDLIRKTTFVRPNIPPAAIRARFRYVPQFVVVNALERASRLRYLGQTEFDKRPHDVISYSNEEGLETSLYFDKQTSLLSKIEWMGVDSFAGDTAYEVVFPSYRTDGKHQLATGRLLKAGGELNEELRYERLELGAAIADDKFRAPEGFRAVEFPPAPTGAVKLAENVYTVTVGGYNVLFVGFKDHVFVMEAPDGDATSRQAIDEIKKTFPGKPIRYVAVTHHHDDHAGGIRTYIAEGATVIAAPGEKAFFELVAKSKFTIGPESLAMNPKPLKIETIEGRKRVFTDGVQTIEIHDIGPGPHTQEMLVAYLPNEKILFQGDLLNRPSNGDYPTANETSVHFAEWIAEKKLAVERIVPVHGTITTMDELKKAVADAKAGK